MIGHTLAFCSCGNWLTNFVLSQTIVRNRILRMMSAMLAPLYLLV